MQITFTEANDIYTTFSKALDKKLPVKLSYKIMKILKAMEGELAFYRDQLKDLILECAQKDESGQVKFTSDGSDVLLDPSKIEDFNTRHAELTDFEIQIPDYYFNIDELEPLELTPKEMFGIENLILELDEDEEEDEE